jgi:hypothetical protein
MASSTLPLTRCVEQRTRMLALRSGGPTATASLLEDGTVELTWMSDAMAELLDPAQESRPAALGEALSPDSASRLAAAVRDLVRLDGRSASVAVTVQRGWPRQVWLDLHVEAAARGERWLTALGGRPARRAAVHAEIVRVGGATEGPGGHAELAEGLRQALHRRRRWSSRIVVAMVTALHDDGNGLLAVPAPATAELADRVRHAARGTDAVVVLGPGRFAVVAEDVAENGETVVARRVLAVMGRAAGDAGPLLADVAVMEVADVDADPDAVIDALLRAGARSGRAGGVTVLSPWTAARDVEPGEDDPLPPAGFDQRLRTALTSGRFVPGVRCITPLNRPDVAARTLSVIETGTLDEGLLSPVRVGAPGLAVAIDLWLVHAVGELPPPGDGARRVLLLQPGGELGPSLADGVAELSATEDRTIIAVPEGRLRMALTAERAVLRQLARQDVSLAVTDWTGAIDVPTLVRGGIGLVLVATETQRSVTRPEGAALLAGLVAGLRAGLGEAATVLAVDPEAGSVTAALEACGIVCAASTSLAMMGAP